VLAPKAGRGPPGPVKARGAPGGQLFRPPAMNQGVRPRVPNIIPTMPKEMPRIDS